ncbi:hypothetical protein PROFUN_11109, partial [Planoprotostelium fungivorum]
MVTAISYNCHFTHPSLVVKQPLIVSNRLRQSYAAAVSVCLLQGRLLIGAKNCSSRVFAYFYDHCQEAKLSSKPDVATKTAINMVQHILSEFSQSLEDIPNGIRWDGERLKSTSANVEKMVEHLAAIGLAVVQSTDLELSARITKAKEAVHLNLTLYNDFLEKSIQRKMNADRNLAASIPPTMIFGSTGSLDLSGSNSDMPEVFSPYKYFWAFMDSNRQNVPLPPPSDRDEVVTHLDTFSPWVCDYLFSSTIAREHEAQIEAQATAVRLKATLDSERVEFHDWKIRTLMSFRHALTNKVNSPGEDTEAILKRLQATVALRDVEIAEDQEKMVVLERAV